MLEPFFLIAILASNNQVIREPAKTPPEYCVAGDLFRWDGERYSREIAVKDCWYEDENGNRIQATQEWMQENIWQD